MGFLLLFLASMYPSSLPNMFVCTLTLQMVYCGGSFSYCSYDASNEEFVKMVILGGVFELVEHFVYVANLKFPRTRRYLS